MMIQELKVSGQWVGGADEWVGAPAPLGSAFGLPYSKKTGSTIGLGKTSEKLVKFCGGEIFLTWTNMLVIYRSEQNVFWESLGQNVYI